MNIYKYSINILYVLSRYEYLLHFEIAEYINVRSMYRSETFSFH